MPKHVPDTHTPSTYFYQPNIVVLCVDKMRCSTWETNCEHFWHLHFLSSSATISILLGLIDLFEVSINIRIQCAAVLRPLSLVRLKHVISKLACVQLLSFPSIIVHFVIIRRHEYLYRLLNGGERYVYMYPGCNVENISRCRRISKGQ